MKKSAAICFTILALFYTGITNAQLDSLLQKHFTATGQEKLATIQSIKASGKIVQMGFEIPIIYYQVRPHMMRNEGFFQDQTFIEAFNGTEGWTVNPFSGNPEPQPMAAEELKQKKMDSDIDGMLWNYKEKGYVVSYEGKDSADNILCYKLKVVVPDSDIYHLYIDEKTFLLVRINTKTTIQGLEVESDTYQSNFVMVDGISFPGKVENRYAGQTALTLIFDKFELNVPVDKTIFDNPKKQ